jgi:hypothetical protein
MSDTKIPNGSEEITEILDDNGSTHATITSYYGGGKTATPRKHRYRLRIKVTSHLEEEVVLREFIKERLLDKTILDPAIEYEYSPKGKRENFYYVIKCYTKLEY